MDRGREVNLLYKGIKPIYSVEINRGHKTERMDKNIEGDQSYQYICLDNRDEIEKFIKPIDSGMIDRGPMTERMDMDIDEAC